MLERPGRGSIEALGRVDASPARYERGRLLYDDGECSEIEDGNVSDQVEFDAAEELGS